MIKFNEKPARSTPESRRQRKAEARAIKAEFHPELYREKLRDQEQTPVVTADLSKANDFRLTNSSLRTISKDKLEAHKGEKMYSTFKRKPGRHTLSRVRRNKGHRIKTLRQRTETKGTRLKIVGRRGRRLDPKDRAARKEIAGLPCVCGCNRPAFWVHLRTRSDEANRHRPEATVPGCIDLDYWLDQGPGTGVKESLFQLALISERRLVHNDLYKILSEHAYYTWLHDRRIP